MSSDWVEESLAQAGGGLGSVEWPDGAVLRERGVRRRRHRRVRDGVAVLVVLAVVGGAAGIWWPGASTSTRVAVGTSIGSDEPCAGEPPGCGVGGGNVDALANGHWAVVPSSPLGSRSGTAGVWTGGQWLSWGGMVGTGSDEAVRADGAAFDAATRTWTVMPAAPLSARAGTAAIWTGKQALFWGGSGTAATGCNADFHDGASYDPATRSWRVLPASPLSGRSGSFAVWTGSEAIVLGGETACHPLETLVDGATYQPSTRRWQGLPAFPGVTGGTAVGMTAVWTGREVIAWVTYEVPGPESPIGTAITGHLVSASWSPGSTAWVALPSPPNGTSTLGANVIWTGSQVLLIGGSSCLPPEPCSSSIGTQPIDVYTPATGAWAEQAGNAAASGDGPIAWTGQVLVTLNGASGGAGNLTPGDAVAYDPASRMWTALPPSPVSHTFGASLVWTGRELLAWGGDGSGAALAPGSPSTRATQKTAPPGQAILQITLDHTTVAANGQPISGLVVVDNETGQNILAPDGTCDGWIEVGLANARIPFEAAGSSVACPALVIPKGISRYALTVQTSYESCAEPGGTVTDSTPSCIGANHDVSPPLPPGSYSTKIEGVPSPIRTPSPVQVTLVGQGQSSRTH